MRKISAQLVSTKPISLSRAAKLMSRFAGVDNGSSATVSIYIERTAEALEKLVQFHESTKPVKGTNLRKQENSYGETTENSRKRKGEMDDGTISQECGIGDVAEVEKKSKKKKKKSDGKKRDKASDS